MSVRSMGLTDFSSSPFISKAVRGLSNLSVKTKKRTPDWDIRVVLAYLMSDEFEPLDQVSLRNLTWKASFLVALATGRRASEVLNFSGILGDVATERDGSISLCFLPEFIAKNQIPEQRSPSVSVRPLTHLLDSGEPDTVNCPVRALKLYRRRTRNIRSPSQRKLFISYNEAYSKDIRATSLSRWFKSLIIGAYKRFEGTAHVSEPIPLIRPRAHEIRAWV